MDLADSKYIKNLIQLMGDSDLSEISIEEEKVKLTLKRDRIETAVQTTMASIPQQINAPAPQIQSSQPAAPVIEQKATKNKDNNIHYVTAPLVGTFYNSSAPDAPAYVQKGDKVAKGQTLCIVEAMKLMNEIESDVDGVIAEVLCDNASPVEFGSNLFAIRVN